MHERDEWANDNRHPWQNQRRHLVAQRFARTGGHNPKGIVPLQDGFDKLALARAERIVAKPAAQNLLRLADARPALHFHVDAFLTRFLHCSTPPPKSAPRPSWCLFLGYMR